MWAKALIDRFKDSVPTAMKKLSVHVYTQDDAMKGQDIRAYAATVMRHANAADIYAYLASCNPGYYCFYRHRCAAVLLTIPYMPPSFFPFSTRVKESSMTALLGQERCSLCQQALSETIANTCMSSQNA